MISGIFIYNHKGEVLISRLYREDIKRSTSDVFRIHVLSNPKIRSPINACEGYTFFHVRHENLFIVAACVDNVNAALIFEFLYKFVNIGKSYFVKFAEENVKNNFVLIYELLDEILDFGYPQNNDVETLKMFITTEGVRSEKALKEDSSKITIQTTGATSWRRPDVKYRNNEVFVDVIESVNLLMSAKGTVLKSDVSGQVVMRAYLSGMPECKLGLNDKLLFDRPAPSGGETGGGETGGARQKSGSVELDDVQFHQCVKLSRFDAERSISFIPPDGEFELMRYRTNAPASHLPFRIIPLVNELKSKVEYKVVLKSVFNGSLCARNVVIRIPTPMSAARAVITVPMGRAKYASGENAIVWKIAKVQGDSEFTLSAEVELSSMIVKKAWSRPPISMDFKVLGQTSSGLTANYLKVFEKSGYKATKWIQYYSKAGSYQFRF